MRPLIPGLCLVLLLSGSISSQPLSEGRQQEYVQRCIKAIINGEYTIALSLADSVAAVDSLDPTAPLCRCTALGVKDIDFDTVLDSTAFLHAFIETERRCASYEKSRGTSSYTKTVSGFSKGFLAAYYLRNKLYLSAMRKGFQSLGLLEDAYRLDSMNADPLFLLGLFEYAKGELKQRIGWVLFWYPGSKISGIERLKECLTNGYFASAPAAFALAEIYIREKKPEECSSLIERLERDFPDSRFTLWAQAKHFESQRLFCEAALTYKLLAVSYAAEPAGRYNSFLMRNLQAHMLLRAGQTKESADSCRSMLRETPAGREIPVYHDTKKLLQQINDRERQ